VTRAGILLIAVLSPTLASAVATVSPVKWCALDFEARKFLVTLHARLEIAPEPAPAVIPTLIEPSGRQGVTAAGPELLRVRLRSSVRNEHSDLTLLMDPATGAALQLRRVETGQRNRVTTLRYTTSGVFRTRYTRMPGEEALSSTAWSRQPDLWRPFPSRAEAGIHVGDPAALFYLLAASSLSQPGDVVQLPMFSNDQLLLVDATAGAWSRARVEFHRTSPSGATVVNGPRSLLRIALDARPFDSDSDGRNFELAGLRGDVVMLLDPEHRLPVEFSGEVPLLGRVTLRLRRAEFNCPRSG
jgi:hypothetical protein